MTSSLLLKLEPPLFGQVVRQVVKLRSEQFEACLQHHHQAGERISLGQVMLAEGLITREQIAQVLRLQAQTLATALQEDMAPDNFPCRAFMSLCLPAYNEEANIEDTLDAACAILPEFVQRFEVVVVDDGSKDQTAEKVTSYAQREPRVRLVRHPQNQGYGAAVGSGLRNAQGDLIMFSDSDGQFSLLDLARFLVAVQNADVVVGYRYQRADPWHRRLNAWNWNRLVRLTLGVKVRDLDCAFKLFRREVLDQLRLTATGAAINAEIMVQCFHKGLRITQLPVHHYPRFHGSPTGAAIKVIMRAFRELPPLWKYRAVPIPAAAGDDSRESNLADVVRE